MPKKTALIITSAGADFYLALKDNQPTLYGLAQQRLDLLPSAWTSETESAHGRIEYRELRVAPFDLDVALFPGARQLASLTRYYQSKLVGEAKQETRHFILSNGGGRCQPCQTCPNRTRTLVGGKQKPLAEGCHPLARRSQCAPQTHGG